MAMVTAMVMATEADRTDWRTRRRFLQHCWNQVQRCPAPVPPLRVRSRCLSAIGCLLLAGPALADNWKVSASAGITETYTNNVNYAPGSNGDFATSITGGVAIDGAGPRVRLNGSVSATATLYANESQNNSFSPNVSLAGTVEAIENFLFFDAQVSITPSYFSPFGPQPGNIVNATANRYTSYAYSFSPYLRGRIPGTSVTYQVRDDNYWSGSSTFGNSSITPPGTYYNTLNASINSPVAPWGWTIEYKNAYYAANDRDTFGSYRTQQLRGIVPYQIDPQFQLSGRIGYEKDQFPLTSSNDVIYGAGFQWAPSDRTQATGFWEHRFFGSSYSAQVSHRLPRIALTASAGRGLNAYPQNALTIPAGANVAAFVDAAFATRIPDPAERALAVQQFLAQTALPPTLATPVNVFAASIQLQTTAQASAVLLGARNSLAFNVYYTKSAAIAGTGAVLPPALQFGQDNTQTGAGVAFSHQLTPFTGFTASATLSSTKSDVTTGAFANARSNNAYLTAGLGTRLGPRTTGSLSASYSRFSPSGDASLVSTASYSISAGLNHTF